MTERILSQQYLKAYREYLIREEKSALTVEKYLRDVGAFFHIPMEKLLQKNIPFYISNFYRKKDMRFALLIPCWHLSIVFLISLVGQIAK